MLNTSASVGVFTSPDPRKLETENGGGEAMEALDTPGVPVGTLEGSVPLEKSAGDTFVDFGGG